MDTSKLRRMEVKGVRAFVRPETSDPFVVNEVIKGNEYRKLHIKPSDIVLDCGMNIGMFTITALQKGATVYSFEPDKSNFDLAGMNIKLNDNGNGYLDRSHIYNKAVTGTSDLFRRFSINTKKNKGAHSLVEKKGRDTVTVQCEHINSIIKRVQPTIIKMDIEGGEYECLKVVSTMETVNEFIMEFHHAHLNDIKSRTKYHELIEILQSHFPNVDYRPETKKAWVSIVYCSR